ncbi:peptidoglycan DD-metalloendopeptidase family protein, partial [Escherichia coli]|nr:peptidoglycan DD-metalloendopeptidase family protein [Escherichia coli]
MKPGSEVFAVCDGRVHSFANNAAERDYGPTIILEHNVSEDLTYYTLYGHLSISSIVNLKKGQLIKKGAVIGYVGS